MGNQRRVSPRLKCIYESKQLHYGTSLRLSSQCSRDKKSRVAANNHFIQMTPPIVSTEKKADREATQNIVSNAFEPQNGSNVQVPVSFDHSMNNQRRVSPRLKCIYEGKQLRYGTSRRVSSQCPRDKRSRVTANNHFIQKTPPIVSTEKKAGKEATQYMVSNTYEPQNGSSVQVPVSFNQSMNNQRRVSPRLKCIYESKQLHYGTSRRVSSQCPRDKKSQVTANNHFIQKTPIVSTEKKPDKEATESITNNAFEPQNGSNVQVPMSFNWSMNNQICENISFESSLQRRVSPRLKCIYESMQLHYETSQRVSSQCQRDKKSQVTANNHFIQTIPIVSTEKKADREATQNIVSNSFEPQNGRNVHVPVSSYQSMNNQGSLVQRRSSPRLKNISESKRPYYGVSQTSKLQTSRDDENQKNVNSDHFIAKSSPIMSRKRDADKGFTSELYHLEPIDLPNGSSGNVKNQGSKSDLTVFVKASCSVSSANGSIDSKGVDPKWLDGCNISPIADGKSPDTMVKETLRASYIHYRHVVQEKEKRCKKEEVHDLKMAKGLKRKVVEVWPEKGVSSYVVYKYCLHWLEGQPKLNTTQVHFTRSHGLKSPSKLPGLVSKDISGGQEDISIPVTNLVDDAPVAPTGFIYSNSIQVVDDIYLPPNAEGCNCKGNCTNPKACACARLNGTDFPYVREKGDRLIEAKDVVFECGPNCHCGPDCINRTSQRGIKFQLEVFRMPKKGWAVCSRDFIPSGAPVCEYIGVLKRTDELDNVAENDYIFEIDCLQTMKEIGGREKRLGDASMPINIQLEKTDDNSVDSTPEFCIDAGSVGNVARFINHSCDPNLFVQCVLSMHHDARLARVVLFSSDDIAPFQELTYDYGYALDSVVSSDGKVKQLPCHCGATDCRKRLY